jgi:hypothetical protein
MYRVHGAVDLYSKATSSPEPLANPAASLEATSRYMPSTVLNADHVTATNPFVPVKEHESMLKVRVWGRGGEAVRGRAHAC